MLILTAAITRVDYDDIEVEVDDNVVVVDDDDDFVGGGYVRDTDKSDRTAL